MSVPWSPPEMFEDDPQPRHAQRRVLARGDRVHAARRSHAVRDPGPARTASLDLIGRIERGAITPIDRADVPRSLDGGARQGHGDAPRRPLSRAPSSSRGRCSASSSSSATRRRPSRCRTSRRRASATDRRRRATPRAHAPCARSRRSRAAAVPAPTTTRTRARTPQQIDAQPGSAASAPAPDERTAATVVRRRRRAPRPPSRAHVERRPTPRSSRPRGGGTAGARRATQVRPKSAGPRRPVRTPAADPARLARSRSRRPHRRHRRPALVVVAAIGIADRAVRHPAAGAAADDRGAASGEDAVVAATVPAPDGRAGRARRADGASVAFAVSHDDAEDGDRYRWQRVRRQRARPRSSDGPSIVVGGRRRHPSASASTCRCSAAARRPRPSTGCTP